jgi:hypothetical protein
LQRQCTQHTSKSKENRGEQAFPEFIIFLTESLDPRNKQREDRLPFIWAKVFQNNSALRQLLRLGSSNYIVNMARLTQWLSILFPLIFTILSMSFAITATTSKEWVSDYFPPPHSRTNITPRHPRSTSTPVILFRFFKLTGKNRYSRFIAHHLSTVLMA